MEQNNKIAKYKKRREINISIIVFLFILIYIIISVIRYFMNDHLSIYEVKEGATSDNNIYTGLIIRDEEVITSNSAGYITYYYRDGDRVAKNSPVFSVTDDASSAIYLGDSISYEFSNEDIDQIYDEVLKFQKNYQNNEFSKVYDFKYQLENTILQVENDAKLFDMHTSLQNDDTNTNLRISSSNSSGVVTFYSDSMEDLTIDNITSTNFNQGDYKKTILKTSNLVENNSPIYKMIQSDLWNIIVLIDEDFYNRLISSEKTTIKITIKDDGLSTTVPITAYKKGDEYFAKLDMSRYMVRYINQRYLQIELGIYSSKGLKIPISSILEKNFYVIPLEFFEEGGNSNSKGIIIEDYTQNNNGEVTYIFTTTELYYKDDTYAYIDTKICDPGTWIYSQTTGERYQVSLTQSLEGVYNINKGYAVFRRIERLYDNEEYCIIKKGTEYGISVYDHIALTGTTAVKYDY